MHAVLVVIVHELGELPLEVRGAPKQNLVEIFAPDRSDQSFDEGMRDRGVRNRLDFFDTQYPQVGLPSLKRKQRIMIRAEVFWGTPPRNGQWLSAAFMTQKSAITMSCGPSLICMIFDHSEKPPARRQSGISGGLNVYGINQIHIGQARTNFSLVDSLQPTL